MTAIWVAWQQQVKIVPVNQLVKFPVLKPFLPLPGQDHQEDCAEDGMQQVQNQVTAPPQEMQALRAWR